MIIVTGFSKEPVGNIKWQIFAKLAIYSVVILYGWLFWGLTVVLEAKMILWAYVFMV